MRIIKIHNDIELIKRMSNEESGKVNGKANGKGKNNRKQGPSLRNKKKKEVRGDESGVLP